LLRLARIFKLIEKFSQTTCKVNRSFGVTRGEGEELRSKFDGVKDATSFRKIAMRSMPVAGRGTTEDCIDGCR
jgi:hypothetical protein